MTDKPVVNLDYMVGQRYVVEIKDEESGKVYYSLRINAKATAQAMKSNYNNLKGYVARLFDTKTGKVFEEDVEC